MASLPPYSVRRSARARRVRLTVTGAGEAVVVLPQRTPLRAAVLIVEQHAGWLEQQLARNAAARARLAARPPLLAGRPIDVNGIPHRVRVEELDRERSGIERRLGSDGVGLVGELVVRLGRDGRGPTELLDAWLRAEARRILLARVAALAVEMAVRPGRVTVRAQRTRWGSASRDGSLSFNWRLLLAPPFVLDAVVVHELAHLRIRGHSAPFWALARQHAPRTDEARAWLRAHHRELLVALE